MPVLFHYVSLFQLSAGGVELEKCQTKLHESEEHLKKLEEDPKGELQKKIRILEKKLADVTSRASGWYITVLKAGLYVTAICGFNCCLIMPEASLCGSLWLHSMVFDNT